MLCCCLGVNDFIRLGEYNYKMAIFQFVLFYLMNQEIQHKSDRENSKYMSFSIFRLCISSSQHKLEVTFKKLGTQ